MLPNPADLPDQPVGGPYGWLAAAIVTILAGAGSLWSLVRKGKTEDSTTALTHANTIIKGYERYVSKQDARIAGLEDQAKKRDEQWRGESQSLWQANWDMERRERRCQLRLEWLCEELRKNDITVPPWPFDEGDVEDDR